MRNDKDAALLIVTVSHAEEIGFVNDDLVFVEGSRTLKVVSD